MAGASHSDITLPTQAARPAGLHLIECPQPPILILPEIAMFQIRILTLQHVPKGARNQGRSPGSLGISPHPPPSTGEDQVRGILAPFALNAWYLRGGGR